MKVAQLQGLLAPFKTLSNPKSLATKNKALYLSPTLVRGCSSYGILEAGVELALPAGEECFVDAQTFLSVLASLPDGGTLELALQAGALCWQAGSAKGKLAVLDVQDMPVIEGEPEFDIAYEVTAEFIKALDCGALSCNDESLANVGMYGVVINNIDFPSIGTSDNTTISFCPFGDEVLEQFPESICLPPKGTNILSSIVRKEGIIWFGDETFNYADENYRFLMRSIPPLKHDIRGMVERFCGGDIIVPIPPDRVQAFIRRATALAETKKSTYVSLGAAEGHLFLSFSEGVSESDEFYLIDEMELPDMPAVRLDANKLARALSEAQEVVMDFMDKKVVVLTNTKTFFQYIISE
jgi:hypothetical protein